MEIQDVSETYTVTVQRTRPVVLAALIIGLISLISIVILYALTYTGHIKYRPQAGKQGPPGEAGIPGEKGFQGPPGQSGPQGLSAPSAPFANFQSGSVTVEAPQNGSRYQTFIIPFLIPYPLINGIPSCFINTNVVNNDGEQQLAFATTLSFDATNQETKSCTGTVSLSPTQDPNLWTSSITIQWWSAIVIPTTQQQKVIVEDDFVTSV